MNATKTTTEMKDKKVMLSALWLFAMLNYTYGDVVTLMDPVYLKGLIATGAVGGLQITQGFLLGASIFQEIPIAMVLLSLILKYRANRWANIIAGTIMTVALIVTLFVAVPTLHYVFFSIIEIACTAFIVWYAWRWPNPEARGVDAIPNDVVRPVRPKLAPEARGRSAERNFCQLNIRCEAKFLPHEVNVEWQGPTVATGHQSVKRASRNKLQA